MDNTQKGKGKRVKNQAQKVTPVLSLEERLKVIANLIVDRIVEDQINGNLRVKTQVIK